MNLSGKSTNDWDSKKYNFWICIDQQKLIMNTSYLLIAKNIYKFQLNKKKIKQLELVSSNDVFLKI